MTSHKGFTLTELLIVIVIMGVVSSMAVLTINVNKNKQLESISQQVIRCFQLAETEAMLRPATLGFVVTKNTFQFYEYQAPQSPDEKKTPWHALSNGLLGLHQTPSDTQMTLKIHNKVVSGAPPNVIISPSGDMTPFILLIGKKDKSPRYRLKGSANGIITSEIIN